MGLGALQGFGEGISLFLGVICVIEVSAPIGSA